VQSQLQQAHGSARSRAGNCAASARPLPPAARNTFPNKPLFFGGGSQKQVSSQVAPRIDPRLFHIVLIFVAVIEPFERFVVDGVEKRFLLAGFHTGFDRQRIGMKR
jgi:hypothetical protein